jgi:glucose-6-phosphate-specific signal transduction histidine kinase
MGRGIVGMRERVKALGGTLTVTTTDPLNAQFVVDARLPGVVTRRDPSESDSGTLAP